MATKQLSRPTFGVPSAEVIGRIGTSDQVEAFASGRISLP
jgi:hypothetical protein